MAIVQYTDAILTLRISGKDMSQSTNIIVTLAQKNTKVDLSDVQVADAGTLVCYVKQNETAPFSYKKEVEIQANGFLDGKRWGTEVKTIELDKNLKDQVIDLE